MDRSALPIAGGVWLGALAIGILRKCRSGRLDVRARPLIAGDHGTPPKRLEMSPYTPLASAEVYKRALVRLPRTGLGSVRRELLSLHYRAPGRKLTAGQMASLMGYKGKEAANLQYGGLAADLARELGLHIPGKVDIRVLATFSWPRGVCHWRMRPELATALEELRWV